MKSIITNFCRIFVGVLFIISGLVKLNDPVGFAFKLEEYFGETVLNLPFLMPFVLAIALTTVIIEVVLGVMLLVGFRRKFTIWALLLMIVFFTFLTFYSAYFNKVTDCGCFGDAIPLNPWQSFSKDIVLLVLILILLINIKLIKPLFNEKTRAIIVAVTTLLCILMGYWVLNHLPFKDFRAYSQGTNIIKGMEIPENAPKSVVEMIFVYDVNGTNTEFTDKQLTEIPEGATFISREDKVISEGYVPPIHDFSIEKDGFDYTEEMLEEPKLMMFVSYDLALADKVGLQLLEKLHLEAKAKGYKVIGMTASADSEISTIKKENNLTFDYYFCDATTLKTIERANPSIVILNNGVIAQKVHYNDINKLKL